MLSQVEIQVELEELEQDDTMENGDLFEFDPFDVVVGQEGDDQESDVGDADLDSDLDVSSDEGSDDDEEPDLPSNVRHMQEMVNKLDYILKLIFDHFNRLHYITEASSTASPPTPHSGSPFSPLDTPRSPSPESGRAMRAAQFHTLLAIFDRVIIRTFKSRYTQFLVFWYSSLDPEFSDLFQGLLVEKALIGQDVPAVTRATAASYIASFVSRAQFVDRDGARRMVAVLCTFLRGHLDAFDTIIQAGQELPSLAHHSVFYAIAQAVFLIFCFRWRDLEEEFDEVEEYQGKKKWMNELDVVQRVITSPLNPLKVSYSITPLLPSLHSHFTWVPGLLVQRGDAIRARRTSDRLCVLPFHHRSKQTIRVQPRSGIGCAFAARERGRARVCGTAYVLSFRSVQASTLELVYTGCV